MISLTYDLHIHSCLSPCGDDDMTPSNIVGMAALKGLDVIALTDHNSCKNCPALLAAAAEYDLVAIPGMEICTIEEVHAVCLFPTLEKAMEFDTYVEQRLIKFPNDETVFGKQQIYDPFDKICGTIPHLLIHSADISFHNLWDLVKSHDGVMFPAHIDSPSNSLISNLGFIPPDSKFLTAEVTHRANLPLLSQAHRYLNECRMLHNSDAHYLQDIHEPTERLCVEERTRAAILKALSQPFSSKT
ncbi:MAG: PHP domain-containing protein [Roseburia sp.]